MEAEQNLNDEILEYAHQLKEFEERLAKYSVEIDGREAKWKTFPKKLLEIQKANEGSCTLNVGGKKFQTSLHTLKSKKGTIFYKQILRQEIKPGSTTFYERDPTYFPIILNFLRTGQFTPGKLDDEEKQDLLNEAHFYEIGHIVEKLSATAGPVECTKLELSQEYTIDGIVVGTNNPKDLKDTSLTKGCVANTPGTVTLTLDRECEFEEIRVGGFKGHADWIVENGAGAQINTSIDKVKWTNVGTLPNEFGQNIIPVKLKKSKAKYIRFTHSDYLGIGYLEIKDLKKK